ncbi:hypothetical protein AALP_AA2G111700 [Arabis alpina]|uniref:Uncharacterized protein n=1 Tax=Arabis alpina TaxID=50452 RepID=A0A087HGP2_ARAAL|nr:hypothetical protein AALP_AA2G111700 [Arabis alpina]
MTQPLRPDADRFVEIFYQSFNHRRVIGRRRERLKSPPRNG